jgi:hypothetical protein
VNASQTPIAQIGGEHAESNTRLFSGGSLILRGKRDISNWCALHCIPGAPLIRCVAVVACEWCQDHGGYGGNEPSRIRCSRKSRASVRLIPRRVDDIINCMWQGREGLRELAVFAARPGALPDQSLKRGIHAGRTCRRVSARAVLWTRGHPASIPPADSSRLRPPLRP